MVLLCNAPDAAPELLERLTGALSPSRAETMRGARRIQGVETLQRDARYAQAKAVLERFATAPA